MWPSSRPLGTNSSAPTRPRQNWNGRRRAANRPAAGARLAHTRSRDCRKGAAALRQLASAAAVRRVVHGGSERGADGADVECCVVKSSGPTCAAARRPELASRAPARSRLLVAPSKWCRGRNEQFAVRLCASRLLQPRWSARTSRGARRAAAKTIRSKTFRCLRWAVTGTGARSASIRANSSHGSGTPLRR
jgi:hypothetical protein